MEEGEEDAVVLEAAAVVVVSEVEVVVSIGFQSVFTCATCATQFGNYGSLLSICRQIPSSI